jgi:dCMP deaminase
LNDVSKWDQRFLKLAYDVSDWSKDPSTKVGAVIARGKRFISLGYNGFPVGVEDTEERLNERELKYQLIVHGERNAIIFAERSLVGCTLYTVPFMPCSVCAGMVIQAGITRVVAPYSDNPRWIESFKLTESMFREAGVTLETPVYERKLQTLG